MKFKRIISTVLAVLMLASAFTAIIAAEEADGTTVETTEKKTDSSKPTLDYYTGQTVKKDESSKDKNTYVATGERVIYTAEDKLEYMDLRFEKDGYQLYVDEYSGEVATRCIATGEILFSNPYTVADSGKNASNRDDSTKSTTTSIKDQLLSQLVVNYIDVSTGDTETYYSHEWAAKRNQITVRNIKNGIRVEYTIGREEARMLVPRQIEKSAFQTKILDVMKAAINNIGDAEVKEDADFLYKKLTAYYTLQDPEKTTSETLLKEMNKAFPITTKMAVWVLDSSTSQTEMATIESLIKTYCPDYTYEELDEDHMLTEYESEDKNPPLFKMALEYTLDELGMTVRLPANGIRFNESLYQLYSVEILPYMGAGANSTAVGNFSENNSGYTFFPDGSGTLFDFEKITDIGATATITGKVYGNDYAYHTISGTHQEIIRYPVFGLVETEDLTAQQPLAKDEKGKTIENDTPADQRDYKSRGFVAIVEEGDALMELCSYHAVNTCEYNTVKMIVYPRPQDTYNVADAISVGSNDTWTVVSARKYTGNYKVRYIMLTDEDVAEEKQITDYYDCSYVGMAKAYREYLESKEILTRIKAEEVKEDIPLYIEAFGALQTTERILSIPVDVMTPLTTFEDVKTMRDDLSAEGINNINFILTGFADGGLTDRQAPYYLDWDGAVDDEMDFDELLQYARDNGFAVYPDFDFAYVMGDGLFDGVSLKKHAVKTIDNRYTSKREYSATKQTYVSYYELAISPAYFNHYYDKFTEEYLEYNPMGFSVSTMGSALNSDFDEDEPYNREDSKNYTVNALKHFDDNYNKVLVSGGNAYSWKYVDYITDVALDSSRYAQSAASVPFLGMVLHGYVEFAGTPINMEGNIDYAILKAIESGASLNFILSYRNTNNLKNYEDLSKYYSVRYDIWFEDVVELYKELNEVLKGVQTSVIESHEFIDGVRVPDDDELIADAEDTINRALENEANYRDAQTQAEKDKYRNARLEIKRILEENRTVTTDTKSQYNVLWKKYSDNLKSFLGDSTDPDNVILSMKDTFDKYLGTATDDAQITTAKTAMVNAENNLKDFDAKKAAFEALQVGDEGYDEAKSAYEAVLGGSVDSVDATAKRTELENDYKAKKADYEKLAGALKLSEKDGKVDDKVLKEFNDAVKMYINQYDVVADAADAFLAELYRLHSEYKLATDEYKKRVEEDANLTQAQRTAILDSVTELESIADANIKDMTAKITAINQQLGDIYDELSGYVAGIQGDDKYFDADTFKLPEAAYEYKMPEEEPEDNGNEYEKEKTTEFKTDDNKIVYEVYENGTAFLLNFNNYKVTVKVDGVNYTLDAYGYIILKKAN